MFLGIEFMSMIIFLFVIGIFLTNIIRGIEVWNRNNNSPRLTVDAYVVSKRRNTTHHNHGNIYDVNGVQSYHTTSSTSYYVTFQVDSGDRMEFKVSGSEYGVLAEGDFEKLSFQGSRYLNFVRETI